MQYNLKRMWRTTLYISEGPQFIALSIRVFVCDLEKAYPILEVEFLHNWIMKKNFVPL